jgi:fumarate hydratase class II
LAQGGTAVGDRPQRPGGFAEAFAAEVANLTQLPFETAPNKFEALAAHDSLVELSGVLNCDCGIADQDRQRHTPARLRPALRAWANCVCPETSRQLDHAGQGQPDPGRDADHGCAQVMGNQRRGHRGRLQGHLELNVFKPLIGANVLRSIELLSSAWKASPSARWMGWSRTSGASPTHEPLADAGHRARALRSATTMPPRSRSMRTSMG